MVHVQEEASPSVTSVYGDLCTVLTRLTNAVVTSVLDRVTNDLDMNSSVTFAEFFKENQIKGGSQTENVFYSDHYRKQIFRDAQRILKNHGYDCRFTVDAESRRKSIRYDARVIHPLVRAFNMVKPFVGSVVVMYGAMRLYEITMARMAEMNNDI